MTNRLAPLFTLLLAVAATAQAQASTIDFTTQNPLTAPDQSVLLVTLDGVTVRIEAVADDAVLNWFHPEDGLGIDSSSGYEPDEVEYPEYLQITFSLPVTNLHLNLRDFYDEERNPNFQTDPPSGYDCDDQPCFREIGYFQLNGLQNTYLFQQAAGVYQVITLGDFDLDVDAQLNGPVVVSSIVLAGIGQMFDPPQNNPFAFLIGPGHEDHEFSLASLTFDGPECPISENCQTVPEPVSAALMGLGLLAFALVVRRRRAATTSTTARAN